MRELEQGTGRIERQNQGFRLLRQSATRDTYSNAQIDDYKDQDAGSLKHQAPVSMRIEAAFSHSAAELKGTAGFGFWNVPFTPGQLKFRFPKTAWFFFGSPPLNLPFAMGVPGHGFKAATMDATHWPFFALLPTAPVGFLLMRNRFLYRHLWPIAQKAIRVSEYALDQLDMTAKHHYQIDWLTDRVVFSIDNATIHTAPSSPTGKMGVVIWIDNQYAVVTPQGNFKWGLLEEPNAQWIDIYSLEITDLR